MCCVDFPVQMRALPTFSYVNLSGAYKFWRDGSSDNFNTFTYLYSESSRSAAIQAEADVSGTSGQAGRIQLGGSSAYIRFDAEL